MIRHKILLLTALVLGTVAAAQVKANEGLKNLIGRPAESSSPLTTAAEFREIIDAVPKQEFKEINERVFVFEIRYDEFAFPTIVSRSEDGTHIWNAFRLAAIPENVSAEELVGRLSKLLAVNGDWGDFFFSYDLERRVITFHGCIQVRHKLDQQSYLDHLVKMGQIAKETESLWSPAAWTRDLPRHVGQWRAENGIQLQLVDGERFQLIVSGTTTTGGYQIDGDQVVMQEDDGERLSGQIRFENANQFTLLVDGNATSFTRM